MFIIVMAFTLMGVSSFLFVSNIERRHLINDSKNALNSSEAEINALLLAPEESLNVYSEIIRRMILRGNTIEQVETFIEDTTSFMVNDNVNAFCINGIYGIFDVYENKFLAGQRWDIPEDYIPQERPWFKAALGADGKIAVSEPYIDVKTGNTVLSYSRRIFDDNNKPLAVICIDIVIDAVTECAIHTDISYGSFGILLNKDLIILAHPNSYMLGEHINFLGDNVINWSDDFVLGNDISARRIKNYGYEDQIAFFRQIKFGWFLGIVIPVSDYYRSVNQMAEFLVVLAVCLAGILCFMLYKISDAKKKSDLRTRQKSNFLATVSHEIRTPLNAILGITEIQLQNNALLTDTRVAFSKIYNSGDLLLSIINDILDLSKIEAGKLELTPAKYDVASLINDVIQLNIVRYESKSIEFKLNVDENIPVILVGDELRIKQILNNLLSNAFKYTDRGEVNLDITAECVGRGGGVHVTLIFNVSDTGRGMNANQLKKLFDEYTRFDLEANRTTEGTGLGMTITRNLINLMYGRISVKSAVGQGTSINVRLPQKTDGVGISGVIGHETAQNLKKFKLGYLNQARKALIKHEPMPYGRILIVDDVETNLFVAKGLMAPYGLKIDTAVSGFEAIDKIKDGNVYDVIFMDHMMPKMDGIETTKLLRGMEYLQPVVALTANALAGQAEIFLNSGFDGFISKPIDIRQLNSLLNKFIRDKQSSEVIEAAHREKAENEKTVETVGTQLAEIFCRDAVKAAAIIEDAHRKNFITESDVQMFIINVHAMKSALANIGETELSGSAKNLEQAGRDKNISVIISETPSFLESLRNVIEKIKPKADEITSDSSEEDMAYLREKLIIIKDSCGIYDKKTAKNVLSELREKTWTADVKNLLDTIAEHLLHSEFDEAAVVMNDYLGE
jgi:signal transduction histidine kinase/DNA-binding NarL/FixJ family response regulator